jgi:cobalamin biosynthesis Mg chelatase CobN
MALCSLFANSWCATPVHTAAALQDGIKSGTLYRDTLKRDAVVVDAIVSTIGFPLVGGPAGVSGRDRAKSVCVYVFECVCVGGGSLNRRWERSP